MAKSAANASPNTRSVSKAEAAFMFVVRCTTLIFAFAFLAPLFAEVIERTRLPTAGLSPIRLGLVIAGIWGAVAQVRGRWL